MQGQKGVCRLVVIPITLILSIFVILVPSAIGQTSQLLLNFPDGTSTGIGQTCSGNDPCTLDTETVKSICIQEGVYSLLFTSHLPDSSTGKFPQIDAHTVNWNYQRYCIPACTQQNVVYSPTAQFCCGAHRSGDCAYQYGNELCLDNSTTTWEFANIANNIGDIYEPLCANAGFVSNGQGFFACGDTSSARTKPKTADRLSITRPGRQTHDYVCAKLDPSDLTSLKSWIECAGGDDKGILTRKQGKAAETGYAINYGLIFSKNFSATTTAELNNSLGAAINKGVIELTIKPSWVGTDGQSHVFFQYTVNDNNVVRILKQRDSTIICQWKNGGVDHTPEPVSTINWAKNVPHKVRMSFDTNSSKMTCAIDGISSNTIGIGKISGSGKVTLNSAPLGAVPGQAELSIKISDVLDPVTLYCAQNSRLVSNLDSEKPTCEKARLAWTGSRCCSEVEDRPGEFYNDPDPRAPAVQGTGATASTDSGGSAGGTSNGTGTTTPGTANEGISFPTGAFIAVTGMQTAGVTNTSPEPICSRSLQQSQACAEVSPPNITDCIQGTPVPLLNSSGCPTGQYLCSSWKATSPGTCWNSTYIKNGQTAPGTNDKVLSVQGMLLACQLSNSSNATIPAGDPNLFSLNDSHNQTQLITEIRPCTLAVNLLGIEKNNRYCSIRTKKWQQTDISIPRKVSSDPTNASNIECCPLRTCWGGEGCVDNQRCDSTTANTHGFRCIDGNWSSANPLSAPGRKDRGYCPLDTMCLVNPAGSVENINNPMAFFTSDTRDQPTCINQSQYILNSICQVKTGYASLPAGSQKTEWKSRAMLLALQLAEIGETSSPNNYAIFCGSFEDVLNFVDYDVPGSGSIYSYLTTPCLINDVQAPCINSFCAMRFLGNKVAFGTSTNIPINNPTKGFLLALGKSAGLCAGAMYEDSAFHACGNEIFYNNVTASIISVPSGITVPATRTEQLIQIRQPLHITARKQLLSDFMNRTTLSKRKAFFDQTTIFGEVYIFKGTGKNYFGLMERDQFNETYVDYVALAYDGFPVLDPITNKKPCDMIAEKITPANLLDNDCDFTGNNLRYVAFAKSPQSSGGSSLLRQFWRDLTAKLR